MNSSDTQTTTPGRFSSGLKASVILFAALAVWEVIHKPMSRAVMDSMGEASGFLFIKTVGLVQSVPGEASSLFGVVIASFQQMRKRRSPSFRDRHQCPKSLQGLGEANEILTLNATTLDPRIAKTRTPIAISGLRNGSVSPSLCNPS